MLRKKALGIISASILCCFSSVSFAEELIWNSDNCKKDRNPEGLCVGDNCFNLCREGDSNLSTSVFYFLGGSCPRNFEKRADFSMFLDNQELSACVTNDPSRVALNKQNPQRVRFFGSGDCPPGFNYVAGTGSVSFCEVR